MKNILVIYYSQTGQLKNILNSILEPLNPKTYNIDYKEIKPSKPYKFPWSAENFFEVFPNSKSGISCKLEPMSFENTEKYDLIILGLQVWYLEASIPVSSFLKSKYAKILNGKNIITVYGVRNMWINAHQTVKKLIYKQNGNYLGNIVLADRHNNLISVLTIVRWLIHNKKNKGKLLPAAGISKKEIFEAKKFSPLISKALQKNSFNNLQKELLKKGAISVDYHIMKTEFAGSKIFNIWTSIILNKSKTNSKKRKLLLKLFEFYLYFVIFVISPISSIVFKLIRLLFHKKTEKEILRQTSF